ncbi:hypothetical protein WA026_000219 [Henosepilachna vigintioctopunctata]|uniref:CUE domain-containing protein n=1 Tax=Henosepilachna vigintioctopunctata TaxID=420089 RepID=A0AAW1V4F6_9CUCU
MNELTNLFGGFSLKEDENEFINYSYFDFFKNPNKLPINNVFIERVRTEVDKSAVGSWNVVESKGKKKECISIKKEVIPALHESWLPEYIPTFEYQEYNLTASEEDNIWFLENNKNYVFFLEYLIKCTYHQFWCSILFKEEVQNGLREFLSHPIPAYFYKELGEDFQKVYKSVFNAFYMVYRRLIFCNESEFEYMPKSLAAKYLIDRKLLNLQIAVTVTHLYQDFDKDLINELSEIYFSCEGQEKFIQKEVENILKHYNVVLQMIKGKLTGKFDPGITVVPISLEDRPKVFSLAWINSVVNYLLNTICSLNALFLLRKEAITEALTLKVPEKLCKSYDSIFKELYDLLEDRQEMLEESSLFEKIMTKLALARAKFVDTFNSFISFLLNETISRMENTKNQQEYLEMFLDIMTAALEYEIFICDFDCIHSIAQIVETFEDVSQIDKTRAHYIITSLNNLERHVFVKEKFNVVATFKNHIPKLIPIEESTTDNLNETSSTVNDEAILEDKIISILGIFPHLGGGFIEKCLENYNYDTDQVVQAILEENLPPHLYDLPFDLPRIPPEPEPPKPILAYKGKKPDYDDALDMLDDKKEKDKMKVLVMEGIKYNNRYNNSDDEYDDRDDLLEPDFVVEHEVEKYEKPNEDDLVSDTSYSENEFDEEGKAVEKNKTGFKPFCEDPAVVRARYEAKFGARRGKSNVVGKPKGQGQEKTVVNARQKKNVQKSSRANHNRKGGSQFKRNRGMIPS